ncbi:MULTISPECIES: hypothetical protein [Pseudomonas]|jgi:hypothetical protein|uniref:Uncharacterized protein n=3 Tax=Pseudomonas syringae TaxID=317 RepID=A0AB37ZIZ0_PSESX|nr:MULTISPECIES: hypothetical protein [Pseudomonas]SFW66376.1 hypothetical protein SAMN03159505_02621 [Pseudomonas sp. NFACC10-1]MBI6668908.1 hypothetical protein [Pseudomonas syringae]MBI6678621.1 hypothetical protein [Pseudomonas syringae]MBI6834935.1 hypothetical protein [Pseudomonas syringae]MCK9727728.1 hypothetical protein [Pseudomonas syringae pv. syringae]
MKKHVKNSRYWLVTTHPGQNAKAVACIQVYRVAGKIARAEYGMPSTVERFAVATGVPPACIREKR